MTSVPFNPTHRPGLAYQHAFDRLAVQLNRSSGPVACLGTGAFETAELLRRAPQARLISASPALQEVSDRFGTQMVPPKEIEDAVFNTIAWAEPLAIDVPRLAEIHDWLRSGGTLHLIVGGRFARFLQERQRIPAGRRLDEGSARRALRVHGFRVDDRLGFHGLRAIVLHQMSTVAGRLGRIAWQDRFHYAMRRDFATRRGLAALVALRARIA